MATETAREHVEEIRRSKFSIGGEANPLTEDLHQAVKNLSAELYAKDVHFLMELIQNAEDNEYSEQVEPSLEFVITSKDITATGAPATLLIFNNEKGFSSKNIDSICSVGRSTKKGNRKRGYIGEKGIGFKSVFLITARPYIFSKGYQIRFNEQPCPHCHVGYIVPEWVDQNPTLSEISNIYGSAASLPSTVLVLPLKPDKVQAVKLQLSTMRPQVLLFLSKIKKLSVREVNDDPRLNTVNGIAITKETDFKQSKSIDAESFTLHLAADENGTGKECSYYMWKQKFPVTDRYRVDRRIEMDEWNITLAFPNGERLQRDENSPGVYAFLPTEMVTNFPFIVQADFLLASSRETILLDNKWNQGILQCIPIAFVNALKSLVEANRDAPTWIFPDLFRFLPVVESNCQVLNVVRESIRSRLVEEEVIPSEVLVKQKFFHKPREVGRLMPSFWSILEKARRENVSLLSLSSHGKYVLCSSFDRAEYDRILDFLQVQPVEDEWYVKCIQGSSLAERVSEKVYLELLSFVAKNWNSKFYCTGINNAPLIKYEHLNETHSLCSMSGSLKSNGDPLVYLSRHSNQVPALIEWNRVFGSVTNLFFMPRATQEAMLSCPAREMVLQWLKDRMNVSVVDVNEYALLLCRLLRKERKLVVAFAHFLYSMLKKGFLSEKQVNELCGQMPLVDSYGNVTSKRSGVLVPANGSRWAGLVLSNIWKEENYVELSDDYLSPFLVDENLITRENELVRFLENHAKANDVPYVVLPNSRIPSVSSALTKENVFLLLKWLRTQMSRRLNIPNRFLESVKEGRWLKITLNGCPGSRSPCESFILNASWGNILQNGSVLVDIPLVDQSYYGDDIKNYSAELKSIGVMTEYEEACQFIGKRLMSLAASCALTRGNVLSILNFISFLRTKCLSPKEFIDSIKLGKWLRTSRGDKSPNGCVLFNEKWRVASEISEIPFVDEEFYGDEIHQFEDELMLMGVVISFIDFDNPGTRDSIIRNLKPASSLSGLSSKALLLLLELLRCKSSEKIVNAMTCAKCLKTRVGYKFPEECIVPDPKWGCLFQIFYGIPLIDLSFYGEGIVDFVDELEKIGVTVDFDEAAKTFARYFKDRASNKSISKENVMSFLSCYRQLKSGTAKLPKDLKICIRETKWLRTRRCDYYRSPKECVLYSPEWESISQIARIPFIDDTEKWYGSGIHEYKKELKSMGVVVDFKEGVKFVENGLHFHNVKYLTRENGLSLLECIAILLKEKSDKIPEEFSQKLSQPWLRTSVGYKPPSECLLFNERFAAHLKKEDGPFLDEEFYGPKLGSFIETLAAIGVVVNAEKGGPLIACQLESDVDFLTIQRLYYYLAKFNWKPKSDFERTIWIPNGSRDGERVSSEDCVVSDKSGLFGSQLHVLDKFYEKSLILGFFSSAFGVKHGPDSEDYLQLWKSWENSDRSLTHDECCKFWGFISKHWTKNTEKTLPDRISKVPVKCGSEIKLVNKEDAFISDDLLLKELFEQSCSRAIFVWYPQPSLPSLPRAKLLEIFQKLGVRTISESVQKQEFTTPAVNEHGEEEVFGDGLIKKGLVRLVLGFLAEPAMGMEAKERHKALESLLKLSIVQTTEPINVGYSLSLPCGEWLSVRASRTVRWDRASETIFTHKTGGSEGARCRIERATCFSEVIAEGVLWENGDRVFELSELIKLGFLLGFDKAAIEFLMKSKNLQVFEEDEAFMASAFPASV